MKNQFILSTSHDRIDEILKFITRKSIEYFWFYDENMQKCSINTMCHGFNSTVWLFKNKIDNKSKNNLIVNESKDLNILRC